MNAPTNPQIIHGPDGKPAFVVIPYAEYISRDIKTTVPHEVVAAMVENDWTPAKAWREHLGLTQAEVASRLGISQPAYAQQESSDKLRKSTRDKIAEALGILPAQLDI